MVMGDYRCIIVIKVIGRTRYPDKVYIEFELSYESLHLSQLRIEGVESHEVNQQHGFVFVYITQHGILSWFFFCNESVH